MSHLDRIRAALSPEGSKTLYGLVNTFGIREDDDRLVPLAAHAMILERITEVAERLEEVVPMLLDLPQRIQTAIQGGVNNAEETVSEAVERSIAVALDLMTTEVRKLVRELVIAEMTTAGTLRTQAIQHEAEGMRRAAEGLAAERTSRGGVPVPGSEVPASGGGVHSWAWGLGGVAIGAVLMLVVNIFRHAPIHH
jgi:hypothetical protein